MKATTKVNDDLREPAAPTRNVLVLGLVGIGLAATAWIVGLVVGAPLQGFETNGADGPRALLCVFGLLLAGCGVSMRPDWYGGWLCGAAVGFISYGIGSPWPPAGTEWYLAPPRNWYAGVPNSWDSVQIFFRVAGTIGLVGATWTLLPRNAAYSLILLGTAFHFAGILSAILSPPPTPWLVNQYWTRVSRPYLQFAYMNNAYQFYSPDPGPACEIWVCVEYRPLRPGEDPEHPVDAEEFKELQLSDDPTVKKDCEWFYIPRREVNYVDPLGLSFYRRLSVTENIAQYMPPEYVPLATEQDKVVRRRNNLASDPSARDYIPRTFNDNIERRVPNEIVSRQILPSYVRYFGHLYAKPDKIVKSIRVYRALHMITTLDEFRGYDVVEHKNDEPKSPYNASLYMPYFQGKFTRDGRLIDSTDPMLYWLVPISPVGGKPPHDREEYRKSGGFNAHFIDYVSRHAGCERPPRSDRD